MFSEGPGCLRTMPRVSLPATTSAFWLRSRPHYTVPEGTVCTAEAAAGVLEGLGNNAVGGAVLRELLAEFQETFAMEHPRHWLRPGYDPARERGNVRRRTLNEWRKAMRARTQV